jgi:hypothetical protein
MEFVDSMTAGDRRKLAGVFALLHEKRPGSKIIQFAAEYLKAEFELAS